MRWYLLFGGWNDTLGGADDFRSLYANEQEAREAGLAQWAKEESIRLASWMHLGVFDSDKMPALKLVACLHIPGAENCATEWRVEEGMEDVLHWIDEGPDDPVYSPEG